MEHLTFTSELAFSDYRKTVTYWNYYNAGLNCGQQEYLLVLSGGKKVLITICDK